MYRLIEADYYINKRILMIGGGDSAIEAAMGLGIQFGNTVTLAYRKSVFTPIKERTRQRLKEFISQKKLRVIFNSVPVEFTEAAVMLEVDGALQAIPNDLVWVLAGGSPPNDFLANAPCPDPFLNSAIPSRPGTPCRATNAT